MVTATSVASVWSRAWVAVAAPEVIVMVVWRQAAPAGGWTVGVRSGGIRSDQFAYLLIRARLWARPTG